ncbi:MAG: hypothetical protein B7Y43_12670 [Sphingomonas sp. 28-62-20]|uniref:antiviral reverse transcriptase Drt2 n=1 Tax=Sphingomonas sp. 28-62-20 TaxID=1970433 RepID=UPI000BD09234|nr:MAG: hypothetical protein B7Y43_12670 [Sphingomonas sp. 28-62-20]
MGRTVSYASGYAPEEDDFDPLADDFVSRERKYLHFDRPLSEQDRAKIRATPSAIMSNSFWPLLAFSKTERRVKRDKKGVITFNDKVREIKFGSHYDSAILEHYSTNISEDFEQFIKNKPIADSILAYRRGVGNNITHANNLFEEIRQRGETTAIAVDISGFFDNIRHEVLLENIKKVRNVERLSDPDYKIFTRMTQFEWVDTSVIEQRLEGKFRPKGRICNAYQFRKYLRTKGDSVVETNVKFFGIPQGTPLSGLYANISLLGFDKELHDYFTNIGGSVRRYSDDIAILIPANVSTNDAIAFVRLKLGEVGLQLSEHKTEISNFFFDRSAMAIVADKPFQYLGFTFDGQNVLIRQSSLNRFYSKMKSGVHAKVLAAHRNGVAPSNIYMRELFRKYTHFGKHRNFPRYAYRASREMKAPEIKKQIANHFNIFKEMVRLSIDSVY